MKIENRIVTRITLIYLITHMVMYILLFGIKGIDDNKIYLFMYAAILSALVYSLFYVLWKKDIACLLIFLAFVFTSIADTFLILLDDYYILALVCFMLTQFSYFIYIHICFFPKRKWFLDCLIRLFTIGIGILIILFVDQENRWITFLATMYFSNLVLNFVYSCCAKKRNPLFIVGLFLFILCDFCVGCFQIDQIIDVSPHSLLMWIKHYPINLSWFFYYPSQILLSIANHKFKK